MGSLSKHKTEELKNRFVAVSKAKLCAAGASARNVIKTWLPELAATVAEPMVLVATGAAILDTVTTVTPAVIGGSLAVIGGGRACYGIAKVAKKNLSKKKSASASEPSTEADRLFATYAMAKKEQTRKEMRRASNFLEARALTFAAVASGVEACNAEAAANSVPDPVFHEMENYTLDSPVVQEILNHYRTNIPSGTRAHFAETGLNLWVADVYTQLYRLGGVEVPTEYNLRTFGNQIPARYNSEENSIEFFCWVMNESERLDIPVSNPYPTFEEFLAYKTMELSAYNNYTETHPSVAQLNFSDTRYWDEVPSQIRLNSVTHETGHALKDLMEKQAENGTSGGFSYEDFLEIFQKECANVSKEDYENYKYYIRPTGGEAFAEIYSAQHGDAENARLLQIFPKTAGYVEAYEAHLCNGPLPSHTGIDSLDWLLNSTPMGDILHHIDGSIGGWDVHFSPSFQFTATSAGALVSWARWQENKHEYSNMEYLFQKAGKAATGANDSMARAGSFVFCTSSGRKSLGLSLMGYGIGGIGLTYLPADNFDAPKLLGAGVLLLESWYVRNAMRPEKKSFMTDSKANGPI